MKTKLEQVRERLAVGDRVGALRIVAKFPRLGPIKEAVERGWNAHQSPEFYRSLGHDPAALFEAAIKAIHTHYEIKEPSC